MKSPNKKTLPKAVVKKVQDNGMMELLKKYHGHSNTAYEIYSYHEVIGVAYVPGHEILLVLFWYERSSQGSGTGWYYTVEAWWKNGEEICEKEVIRVTVRHERDSSMDHMGLDIKAIRSVEVRDKQAFNDKPIKEVTVHFNKQKNKRDVYYEQFLFYIWDGDIVSRGNYEGGERRWNEVHHPKGYM